MKLCVFAASSDDMSSEYVRSARNTAEWLSKNKHELIYGGANCGLMGSLASESYQRNVEITGIVPEYFSSSRLFNHLKETMITTTFAERKQKMFEQAEAFLILPGGIGTMDEFFELLTLTGLGLLNKPVGLYNYNGFYETLLTLLKEFSERGILYRNKLDFLQTFSKLEEFKL